jgi:DNA-binding transcriptional ArsR family regulator
MIDGPYIAEVGALIGDPARANILAALMDDRARTASELAYIAGVSPQTASAHLAKLTDGKLLSMERQGRHRYYRLAGPGVAQALEALMVVASNGPHRHRPPGPRDPVVRYARTCYDHLAGRLGVGIADHLIAAGHLAPDADDYVLSSVGEAFLADFGIDIAALQSQRRAFARRCLDWSERRPHIAGALGAAIASRCFDLGWLERVDDSRGLTATRRGQTGLRDTFGIDPAG